MHFMCESCKASLSIADEKVTGKRLVVRCKRCGSRIQIADPALGMAAILLGPQDGPAAARMSPGVATQAARPPLGTGRAQGAGPGMFARAAPRAAQATAPASRSFVPRRETSSEAFSEDDNESTRAMDAEVLEKALRASKSAEVKPSSALRRDAPRPAATSARAGSFAPPSQRAVAVAEPEPEPAPWFAMIAGKQLGPLSPDKLDGHVAGGALGPRSYVWTEGMAGWVRAGEVPELAARFGPQFQAARPAPPPPRPAPSSAAPLRQKPDARAAPAGWPARPAVESRSSPFDFGRTGALSELLPEEATGAISGLPAQNDEPQPDLELDSYDPAAELDASEQAPALESLDAAQGHEARAQAAAPENPGASRAPGAPEKPAPALQLSPVRRADEDLEDLPLDLDEQPAPAQAQDLALQPDALVPEEGTVAVVVHPAATLPGLAAGRWIKDKARRLLAHPLLLAACGAIILGLVLLVVLPVKSKAPQKALQVPAQEVRAVAPKAGTPGGEAHAGMPGGEAHAATPGGEAHAGTPGGEAHAATPAVEMPIVLGDQGSPAAGSDAPARDPGTAPLTTDDVKRKLDQNKGSLQRCIDEALRRDPRDPALRAGRIRITTTIAPSGAVIGAKIDKRGVDESALGACLKGATGRIIFPSFPGKPVDVDIPIVVTAGD